MSPSRPPAPRPSATPTRQPSAPRPQPEPPQRATSDPRSAETSAAPKAPADARRVKTAPARPEVAHPTQRAVSASTAGVPGAAEASAPAPSPAHRVATTYQVRRFRGPVRPAVVSTRSAERFAERARAARTLARRQVALVGGGVLAVLALGWLVLFSPVLALDMQKVAVTGAGTVVAVDQVTAVVAPLSGRPLPRLDTAGLRQQVLQVPGVRDATVTRDWPTGLSIALVSREPVAAVPEAQAPAGAAAPGFALLDQEGVQVGRVDAAPEGLPVVQVPPEDPRTLAAVLAVVNALPADLVTQVGDVSAHTQDTIAMTLRDGVTVEWGSADETALKAAVLRALHGSPAAAGASVIDVSAPRLPITR